MSVKPPSYGTIRRGGCGDGSNSRVTGGGPQPGYRITSLNRLAFPKGKVPKCELSGTPATVACTTPNITLYYATEEHAEQAWHGKVALFSVPSVVV